MNKSGIPSESCEIARNTCEQLSDLHICGFAKEAHQSWDAPAVLQCDLVIIIGFAIDQVPQSATGTAVHIAHPVIQQVNQKLDAPLSSYLQQIAHTHKKKPNTSTTIFFTWSFIHLIHSLTVYL